MMKFEQKNDRTLKILCFGAHSDDIKICCGGTILRHLSEGANSEVNWAVLNSIDQRDCETLASANKFLEGSKTKKIIIENLKDAFLP